MATKRATSVRQNVSEMQAAAELVLQQEELRQQKVRKRAKRRRRERRQAESKAIKKMHHSIEVIKWCIVGICTVWVISFIISIVVLVKVHGRVIEIEGQVNRIRHVMDNPFASAGARFGEKFDDKLKDYFQIADPQDGEK
jgi:hypothetical protein